MSATQLESLSEAVNYFRALGEAKGGYASPYGAVRPLLARPVYELPPRLALAATDHGETRWGFGLQPDEVPATPIAPATVPGERFTFAFFDGWGGPGHRYAPSIANTQATVVAALTALDVADRLAAMPDLPHRQATAEVAALTDFAARLETHLPRLSAPWMGDYADLVHPTTQPRSPVRPSVGRMPIRLAT